MIYKNNQLKCSFDIVFAYDLKILLIDLDRGKSITNDAYNIIKELDKNILPGGIKNRRVYYRDTMGRYDRILTHHGIFTGFAPCTDNQQLFFADILNKYAEQKNNEC